jgi:hypothetical protein
VLVSARKPSRRDVRRSTAAALDRIEIAQLPAATNPPVTVQLAPVANPAAAPTQPIQRPTVVAPTATAAASQSPAPAIAAKPADLPHLATPRAVIVLAVHAGAGASTVACAIADAASADGDSTRLVDLAPPTLSGLITAADAELGVSGDGAWQIGRRGPGRLAVDRARAGATYRQPEPGDQLLVIDGADVRDTRWDGAQIVLVCRATVPAVRRLGAQLDELADRVAAVAMLGPSRWPGAVAAAANTATRALREGDRIVAVPFDKQLEVEGVSGAALPGRVLVAGTRLLELIRHAPVRPAPAGREIQVKEHP